MAFTVQFISMPFSTRNGTYAVGNLDQYVVHTEEQEIQGNLVDTIKLGEMFPFYEHVSHVRVVETNDVYDVTNILYPDNQARTTYEYVLRYNPITSILGVGVELTGVFDKTQTNIDKYIKEPILNDAMKITRSIELPRIPDGIYGKVCWYEIVMKKRFNTAGETLIRYGGFAYIPKSNAYNGEDFVLSPNTQPSRFRGYPSIKRLMTAFSQIGANTTTASVVGVNVSMRCPYRMYRSSSRDIFGLINGSGNIIDPIVIGDSGLPSGADWCLYAIEDTPAIGDVVPETTTVTLTDMERKIGDVSIVNELNTIVASIPAEYFVNNTLNIDVACRADYGGLYTDVQYNGGKIRLVEGKIPWVGNNWADYQALSMSKDVDLMNLKISSAKEQRNIDMVTSVANAGTTSGLGALSGNPAGALLGVPSLIFGLLGSEMQGRLSERTARAEQEIEEKHQKAQFSDYTNTSEGVIYLTDNNRDSLRVTVAMPMNVDEAYYNKHHEEAGFTAQGVKTFILGNGFLRGRLTVPIINGVKNDLLNDALMSGAKITVIQ